ncbi:MAG: flagellar basal body rod protein FlgB [Oscillospiraceae bacterium]
MNWMDNVSMNLLEKSMDGLWDRQKAISDNIANYETPGYKKKYVTFEQELKNALYDKKNDTRKEMVADIRNSKAFTGVIKDETMRNDGNNVDIESENVELARTQLQFSLATMRLNGKFSSLRYAISGGAR